MNIYRLLEIWQYSMQKTIPHDRRAIVFQGGGALGAYELGFYQALYEKFVEEEKYKNPFDVVIGTSIGAINGALLVSFYQKNHTWKGSVEYMKDFWKYVSSSAPFSDILASTWYEWRKFLPDSPTKEEVRRLFTVYEFLFRGVPNVFSVARYRLDPEFYAFIEPWYQSNNKGLKESLEKFIDFPIATDYKKDEPRLLLVAADVQEALPVTFDSYPMVDGKHRTLYGQKQVNNADGVEGGYVIEYDGIELEHILASASVPVLFDYTKIKAYEVIKFYRTNSSLTKGKQVERYFWDGGLLHNTPIQPLIRLYKTFWDFHIGIEKQREAILNGDESQQTKIPNLEVCVVDMWAQKSTELPETNNDTKSRFNEIMYSDKTEFEERNLAVLNEYLSLSKDLIKLARDKGATHDEIDKLLMTPIKSRFYKGIKRSYIDLIRGRFSMKISKVTRRDDPEDISYQVLDFSPKTIEILEKEGYEDAMNQL